MRYEYLFRKPQCFPHRADFTAGLCVADLRKQPSH